MLLAFLQTPVYEPVARLEIDSAPADPLSREHEAFSPTDAEYLETQAKTLESDQLAIAVIRNLHLDQNVNFLQPNKVPFVWRTLAQLFHRRSLDPPAVQPGRRGMPELSPRENAALRVLRSHLEVKRDTASRLVMVSYSSPDPRLAALPGHDVLAGVVHVQPGQDQLEMTADDLRAHNVAIAHSPDEQRDDRELAHDCLVHELVRQHVLTRRHWRRAARVHGAFPGSRGDRE